MQTVSSSIGYLPPGQAQEKLQAGAKLLDVREYPEWANRHIPNSTLIPLSELKAQPQRGVLGPEILILCASGQRAQNAAELLARCSNAQLWVIEGGIDAWQNAGLAATRASNAPLSLERQVRIGAGSLMLLGLLLAPLRFLAYLVPCGLIFAGLTNRCGLALLLARAPWNRPRNTFKERNA